jgi:large conductance mechanosensitive channel
MSFLQEFKTFAMRGNVIDLAVGVVIGGAFGKIVSSLVANIITPVIGLLVGGVDFKNLTVVLKDGEAPVTLEYGIFLQNIFDFLIVAFAIFLFIKALNKFQKKEDAKPEAAAPTPADIVLLTEIRDLLKK